mgnify:CR=1 FL=1
MHFPAVAGLTGLPPIVGFYGKLMLFYACFESYPWLVVIAGLNSVVSLFYYIKVARFLFLTEPAEETPAPNRSSRAGSSLSPCSPS